MKDRIERVILSVIMGIPVLGGLTFAPTAHSQTLTTIHSFCEQSGCPDGMRPYGGLVQAANGYLWGTTQHGGAHGTGQKAGTIFKITPSGALTTVYNFCAKANCVDGVGPVASMMLANNGELYGTASHGGAYETQETYDSGGTLFDITSTAVNLLDTFCPLDGCPTGVDPTTGSTPDASLVQAPNGDLYGTTEYGGLYATLNGGYSGGTVFKIAPSGALTTLYNFCAKTNCPDGATPSGLVLASDGNFYGSTSAGGAHGTLYTGGTIFKITPSGQLTTLYSFCAQSGCPDGERPNALVQANDGNLYGTAYDGGFFYGTIFKVTTSGKLTVMYNFQGTEGGAPSSALVQGTDGALYGTSSQTGPGDGGSVFKILLDGTFTTLYSFCSQPQRCDTSNGAIPWAGLVQATDGNFYGVTSEFGAYTEGTVFQMSVGLAPFVKPLPVYGAVGATILIIGTDLTGTTAVSFNGTPATFTIASPTSLKATVPAGATLGKIQVTTPAGTLSSNVAFHVSQ